MSEVLKIRGRPIGLIGLEGALQYAERLSVKGALSMEEIADSVLDQLKKRNYIPSGTETDYKLAIIELWKRRHGGDRAGEGGGQDKRLIIRVLGKDCMTCSRLEQEVVEVLNRLGKPADVMHITDMDEIWRYGVFNTPALVINDKVVCQGRTPTPHQIEEWLKDI